MTRPPRRTPDEIEQEFHDWAAGTVTKDAMSIKDWRAMKRRINRAGFKKSPDMYKLSKKGVTVGEWKAKRVEYYHARYIARKQSSSLR
jgi:NOL1/NOP2/fmu family ribosome biogenesis protein